MSKTKKLIEPEKKFTYGVGRPWDNDEPHGSISLYAYGSVTFYGTMASATKFRDRLNERLEQENPSNMTPYRIYMLVEVPV